MTDKQITPDNEYTKIQQAKYNHLADYDGNAPGWDGNGNSFAVEILRAHNAHQDYKDYLWRDIPDLDTKIVLDFGCGPGRNLITYANTFLAIDGVDLAERNLQTARIWIKANGLNSNRFNLYKNNGVDLDGIGMSCYDIVMSTICFQHISVYDIRYHLLEEFYRVLKPGGYITLQLLFSTDKPGVVDYYSNNVVSDTNGAFDCVVGNPANVQKDFEQIGFSNFHYYIRPSAELLGGKIGPTTDNEWIYVNAQKV